MLEISLSLGQQPFLHLLSQYFTDVFTLQQYNFQVFVSFYLGKVWLPIFVSTCREKRSSSLSQSCPQSYITFLDESLILQGKLILLHGYSEHSFFPPYFIKHGSIWFLSAKIYWNFLSPHGFPFPLTYFCGFISLLCF